MKNKSVIGILPTYNLENKENDPYQDRASFVSMYVDKIRRSGGIPIGILDKNVEMYCSLCDGYIWPGGGKIWKEFYVILEDAIKNHKPVLGVCLGSQAIATFFNVLEDQKINQNMSFNEVYQQNKENKPYLISTSNLEMHSHYVTKDIDSIESAKHSIKIEKNSFLYQIYGVEEKDVVSLHSIVIARAPMSVLVSAKCADGVIEAVEYHENDSKILGVQFHPEIEQDQRIFDWLIEHTNSKYQILVNKDSAFDHQDDFQIALYQSEVPECINDSNMEIKTKEAFLLLKEHMAKLGYKIDVTSAYRTTKLQEEIYNNIVKEKGEYYAKKYAALPTHSEHETGLAIDVGVNIDGKWLDDLDERLDDFYGHLHASIADFGFILRYPQGKENITGYNYEPWHIRYIGNVVLARKIMNEQITLEEYRESEAKLCRRLPR